MFPPYFVGEESGKRSSIEGITESAKKRSRDNEMIGGSGNSNVKEAVENQSFPETEDVGENDDKNEDENQDEREEGKKKFKKNKIKKDKKRQKDDNA